MNTKNGTPSEVVSERKLHLPRVRRVTLRRFSLFSLLPEIEVEFPDGVFCLAGANGLGKSTFLSSVNYAITGIVPEPNRKFESVTEYHKDNNKFASTYFNGRIDESDREASEISVEMIINGHTLRLTRGMFETDQLRELEITDHQNVILTTEDLTPEERHQKYTDFVVQHVGLDSFEQLIFLQHLILTFDERRHLLFWDQKVLEQALYLAFGVDPAAAKRADSLRREAERADSLARNAQWQATETRKKIRELENMAEDTGQEPNSDREAAKEKDAEEIQERHRRLLEEVESSQKELVSLEDQLRDARLKNAECAARQATLRAQYESRFSERMRQQFAVANHPLIVSSISDCRCGLCGTEGQPVAQAIAIRLQDTSCPLCSSQISQEVVQRTELSELRRLSDEITEAMLQGNEAQSTEVRIADEFGRARATTEAKRDELAEFERSNERELSTLFTRQRSQGDLGHVLNIYRVQLQDFLRNKEKQREKRDQKQRERVKLQEGIEIAYSKAQEDFVPRFRELANSFLGLELSIHMERQATAGLNLVLGVKDSIRRQDHQLSESQRFFVDIALRMALAQHMSATADRATLFIDTPEGSLDIAYESRAGDMFARFVDQNYHIVMTANINSSQLLLRLAERCGHSSLKLQQMTSWTELSDVQTEEEGLFIQALERIEQAQSGASGVSA